MDVELIYEALPLLVLGLGTGIYGVLVGAGGGFILAPVLILFFEMDPRIAAGTSLALVSVNSLSGFAAYRKSGLIDKRSGILFAIAAITGSVLAPLALHMVAGSAFKVMFGLLLLVLSVQLALKPNYAEKETFDGHDEDSDGMNDGISNVIPLWKNFSITSRNIYSKTGNVYQYQFNEMLATIFNFFLGFVSSFFGTGGGFLRTPILVAFFKFPVPIAVATSIFSLAIYASFGALSHAYMGNIQFYPTLIWSGIGLVLGGQIGARLMESLNGLIIMRLLLVVVLVLGVQLVIEGVGIWPESL